jgi:hypothetical protein
MQVLGEAGMIRCSFSPAIAAADVRNVRIACFMADDVVPLAALFGGSRYLKPTV